MTRYIQKVLIIRLTRLKTKMALKTSQTFLYVGNWAAYTADDDIDSDNSKSETKTLRP